MGNSYKIHCQYRCRSILEHQPVSKCLKLELKAHLEAVNHCYEPRVITWGSTLLPALSRETRAVDFTFCSAGRRRWSGGPLALSVLYSFLWSGRILCS